MGTFEETAGLAFQSLLLHAEIIPASVMSKCSSYYHMSAKDWAWGTTAYWKVYSSLKGVLAPTGWRNLSRKTYRRMCYQKSCRPTVPSSNSKPKKDGCLSAGKGTFSSTFHNKLNQCTDLTKMRNYSSLGSKQLRRFLTSSGVKFNLNEHQVDVLSHDEIDAILRTKEETFSDFLTGNVSFCATSQLSSNQPMEDQVIIATCDNGKSLLAGIIDGHGGSKYGEIVRQRLPLYVSAAMATNEDANDIESLTNLVHNIIGDDDSAAGGADNLYWLVQLRHFVERLNNKHPSTQGYMSLVSNPLRQLFGTDVFGDYADAGSGSNAKSLIQEAFVQLDEDLTAELSQSNNNDDSMASFYRGLSSSGCCALMVLLDKSDLYVANSGDCRAVLGTQAAGIMTAVQLTQDHTAVANPDEVARILMEHPQNESRTCIQYGRLLGRLAPLRAFGDIQFKMSAEEQCKIIGKHIPNFKPMAGLRTPPYLTVQPDVHHFQLQEHDQFVVLASDGLWDMLSNEEVVWLVSGYLDGRGADLLRDKAILSGMCPTSDALEGLEITVRDDNVATFLIRYALGGANRHALSAMLTLPHPEVRMYRDDISVTVVQLNDTVPADLII